MREPAINKKRGGGEGRGGRLFSTVPLTFLLSGTHCSIHSTLLFNTRREAEPHHSSPFPFLAFVDVLWLIDGPPAAVAPTLPKGLSPLPKHLCAPHYCCSSSCPHSPFSIVCRAGSNFSFFVLVETCFVSFSNAPRHHSIVRSNKFTKRRVGNLYPLKTIISIATAYNLILSFRST